MEKEYIVNFIKSDKKDIENAMRNLLKKFFECLSDRNIKEIESLFDDCKQMRYSSQAYLEKNKKELDEDILINIGYVRALLDYTQLYIEDLKIREFMKNLEEVQEKILFELCRHIMMSDVEIARSIGINNEEIKKIISEMNGEDLKVIEEDKTGYVIIYSITPKAYKYFIHRKSLRNI